MKIVIIEVEQDQYKTVTTITLKDKAIVTWEYGLIEYNIDEKLMDELKCKGVVGWVDGVNNFNKPVKRTYMLVED